MSTPDDIDMLAAEYVVGTLNADERRTVAARRRTDQVLDAAILAWEQRLAALDDETAPAALPPALFARIEQRIAAAPAASVVDIATLQRRVKAWRTTAAFASAAAAMMLVFIGARETVWRPSPQQTFIGVFAQDDILPKFYLTIDISRKEMTVRPVGAQRQDGKTYQLWIASDQLGPAPQSLGLVDDGLAPTRRSLSTFDTDLLRRATFGVSVEPLGGSPTGRPSPGALHAKLLPAAL